MSKDHRQVDKFIPESMSTAVAIFDQLLVSATRFATTWMIGRFCGADQLGMYALGFSAFLMVELVHQAFVTAPFAVYAECGTRRRIAAYAGNSLTMAIAIAMLGSLSLVVLSGAMSFVDLALSQVMMVVAVAAIFCIVREFARRYCFAKNRLSLVLALDITCAIVQMTAMTIVLQLDRLSALTAHASVGAACFIAVALWCFLIPRQSRQIFQVPLFDLVRHWRFGRWVLASQMINQLSWNAVQWIIALRLSTEATGVYTGCLSIVFLANPVVLGLANILYPRLANEFRIGGLQAMEKVMWRTALIILLAMGVFTFSMLILGQSVCDFLFDDPAYRNVTYSLFCLAAAKSIIAVTMTFDGGLWAQEQTKASSLASIVGMLVSVSSVMALVHWGVLGGALGLMLGCLSEGLTRIALYLKLRRGEQTSLATASYP